MKKNLILFLLLIPMFLCAKDSWVGKDKVMHLITSAHLTYWSFGLSHDYFELSKPDSKTLSIGFTFALGVGKEVKDRKTTGFSWKDLTYDVVGIGLGMVAINNLR